MRSNNTTVNLLERSFLQTRRLGPRCISLFRVTRVLFLVSVVSCDAHSQATSSSLNSWVHRGFKDFARGQFEDAGSNLYVNAKGIIGMIHNWDVNHDGYPDLVLANSHDYIERGPTRLFWPVGISGKQWKVREMSGDSGWMSRVVDLDKDGFPDLIVANGGNGVTSRLPSYVYWGGPSGLIEKRTDLLTVGAYDVAVLDLNRDGNLDLIFPSAWEDHHNPGRPMLAKVYLGSPHRTFTEASGQYGILGVAAISLATADLNQDGFLDLVVANYRAEFSPQTDSFLYWGAQEGFNVKSPQRLPTYGAQNVIVADLNHDGNQDIVFSGGDHVNVYWNRTGNFNIEDHLVIHAKGYSSMFSVGAVRSTVADLNGDKWNDLVLATNEGIQIRSGKDLHKVSQSLALAHVHWVTASDLNGDSHPDLIVSRYTDGTLYDTESPIFWNSPTGFSLNQVSWVPTKGAVGNTAGDVDGDGRPEVIFNNTMSGHLKGIHNYVYLGKPAAGYDVENRLELPTEGADMSLVADFDQDGNPDLAFVEAAIRIFSGGPKGLDPSRFVDIPTMNKTLMDLQTADFNRDGFLDLLVVGQVYDTQPETLAKSSTLFYGSSQGFSASRSDSLENYGGGTTLADVNKDGYLDVLFCDKRDYVLIYLGDAHGFSKQHTWRVPVPAPSRLNTADLNQDGWLDLIVSCAGHYQRLKDTLHVFYGGPGGFRPENSQKLLAGFSALSTAAADFNRDGNLDLLVTAYSTPTTRVLPAQLFWGNGKSLDLDRPLNLPAEASAGVTQIDLNRDGWIDLVLACHRNDIGHQVNSLIYWNSSTGFDPKRVTHLPGLGPHGMTARDRGNAYTRKPEESYISPPYDARGRGVRRIDWIADVPPNTELRFQLRWAVTEADLQQALWNGPQGAGNYYRRSGQGIAGIPKSAHWLQYRATFVSQYGCGTPQLREVRIGLDAD
ncbi:MAG: VCBS repeat-containing protein [Acidobacteria bacterium]|nr:VCBS repeat-containing protein [Acidobacteriota bacterium]